MVGGGKGEARRERELWYSGINARRRVEYVWEHLSWSVGGLPYQSYPVACVKARDFVVNACTEGEGYRFSIRAAHWHTDGRSHGGRGGREKEGRPIKEGFLPVASAHCALARRPGLVGCAAGCAFITLFNEIRFQQFQESWITCQAVRGTHSFCDCGHDTISLKPLEG